MACAGHDNLASQRTCAKAGFHKDRQFEDMPQGLHWLLARHREDRQIE
jgi:RimJ/RimL family protein N-acetyltransferase